MDLTSSNLNSPLYPQYPRSQWKTLLAQRGILEEALNAGWTYDGNGYWRYPVPGNDGKPAAWRKKRIGTDDQKPKYLWEGKAQPFYMLPNPADLKQAVLQADGLLYLASGEPDVLAFRSAGILNVMGWFGEANVPESLPTVLSELNVKKVIGFPDLDETGNRWAEKIVERLQGTGITYAFYDLSPELPAKGDINTLWVKVGFNRDGFLACIQNLPLKEVVLSSPSNLMKPFNRKATDTHKELPLEFIAAVEQQLGIKGYKADGWSKPIPCPLKPHEHDNKRPSANWHRDKHILHCFKCHGEGEHVLAIEVGSLLGLDWHDYLPHSVPTVSRDEFIEDWPDEEAPEVGSKQKSLPTDDELGDTLLRQWDGNTAYFYQNWYRYSNGVWKREENITRDIWTLQKSAKEYGIKPTSAKKSSVMDYLQAQVHIPTETVDNGLGYVNLHNGLFNLETGNLEPHRRELYLTSQLSFDYDPSAECPIWLRCLDRWFMTPSGIPDQSLIMQLQEAFGYSLTADTRYDKSFWLYGEAGTGKSKVLGVLKRLMGSAYIEIDLGNLHRNDYQLADIPGKRVITCTESDIRAAVNDRRLLQIISGEEVPVRQIRQETFRVKSLAKIWWAMNNLPPNDDRSKALYRRLIIFPFNNPIPKVEQDRSLEEKLQAELPGIFLWAIAGLQRLQQQGHFTDAQASRDLLEEYRATNDLEASFIEECCETGQGKTISANKLYQAYRQWCEENGHLPKSSTGVARDWQRLGYQREKRRDGNYYIGLALKEGR